MGVKKPNLLPLEVQIQLEREKKRKEEAAAEAEIAMAKVNFREAMGDDDSELDELDRHCREIEVAAPDLRTATKSSDYPRKKTSKLTDKVAPLVAAINEQAALGKASQLNDQEQLLRKNKKKAN